MPADSMMAALKLAVALGLIGLNAFFVAVEFSIVNVRPTRIQQLALEGDRRAPIVLTILAALDEHLSATQLGVTLASLGLGWVGEPAVAALLTPAFTMLGRYWPLFGTPAVLHTVAGALAFAAITTLHIVLGELVPKSMAVVRPERVVLTYARPLRIFHRIFIVPIRFLNVTARTLMKALGIQPVSARKLIHTNEELRLLVTASARGGYLDETERDLLDNVFDFSDHVAREVMVPRGEMLCLDARTPMAVSVQQAISLGHSRYPVVEGDKDHVVGMLLLKDLIRHQGDVKDLRAVMRPIMVVPETLSIARLLRQFQRQRGRMAVVVDEYGGTAGLVTLEDLMEELVGDIQDEFDRDDEPEVQQVNDTTYEVDGAILVEEAADQFGWRIPELEGVDTLGGYVTARLGEVPQVGRETRIAGFRVQVLALEGYRVARLRLQRCGPDEPCEDIPPKEESPTEPDADLYH